MATSVAGPPRPGALGRRVLLALSLLVLLIGDLLLPPGRRAAAEGPTAGELVPAVVAAYPPVGTLAVAVARQHMPQPGLSIRAAEARTARLTASAAGSGADRQFPAASMVKLFVAEDVLHRARTGQLVLRPDDPALLRDMIRRSDDPAASALWVRYGGGQMVTDVARRYRLAGTAPPAVAGQWGSTTTTAGDLARFLALLPTAAHPDDAAALLAWMREATDRGADGFDQRFGVFGPGLPAAAVKQGWMCCLGGSRHLHSIGVVGTRVVVLLSEVPRTTGYDTARAALTSAAAAIPPPAPRWVDRPG